MLLDAADDEVHEGHDGQGAGGGDGARSRLAARDDADDVVGKHHQEERGDEREVLAPGVSQKALAHVVTHELDQVLHGVHEAALRHEAHGLLLLEGKEQHEHEHHGHGKPERVLGEANGVQVAHDGRRRKARDELVDLTAQGVKRIHLRFLSLSGGLEPAVGSHPTPHGLHSPEEQEGRNHRTAKGQDLLGGKDPHREQGQGEHQKRRQDADHPEADAHPFTLFQGTLKQKSGGRATDQTAQNSGHDLGRYVHRAPPVRACLF